MIEQRLGGILSTGLGRTGIQEQRKRVNTCIRQLRVGERAV